MWSMHFCKYPFCQVEDLWEHVDHSLSSDQTSWRDFFSFCSIMRSILKQINELKWKEMSNREDPVI